MGRGQWAVGQRTTPYKGGILSRALKFKPRLPRRERRLVGFWWARGPGQSKWATPAHLPRRPRCGRARLRNIAHSRRPLQQRGAGAAAVRGACRGRPGSCGCGACACGCIGRGGRQIVGQQTASLGRPCPELVHTRPGHLLARPLLPGRRRTQQSEQAPVLAAAKAGFTRKSSCHPCRHPSPSPSSRLLRPQESGSCRAAGLAGCCCCCCCHRCAPAPGWPAGPAPCAARRGAPLWLLLPRPLLLARVALALLLRGSARLPRCSAAASGRLNAVILRAPTPHRSGDGARRVCAPLRIPP
jgi:hypothetical protein